MYVIIWEYHVKAERAVEFEKIYASDGEWADLFTKEDGYLGTELLCDSNEPLHYMTIDRWVSSDTYHSFRARWQAEYKVLDEHCQNLTDREVFLGALSPITKQVM